MRYLLMLIAIISLIIHVIGICKCKDVKALRFVGIMWSIVTYIVVWI